jgi:hypothetical protein
MKHTLISVLGVITLTTTAAQAQNTTLWMDSAQSQWEWTMTAMNASAVPVIDNEFEWSGVQFAELGMNASGNVSSGTFENGTVAWTPDIMGYFPNPMRRTPHGSPAWLHGAVRTNWQLKPGVLETREGHSGA